ncbi:hypothetical protein A3L04_04925 [Thermococcus chitonophagus]|uniref:DUF2178 domain-containing protein n=1 Tax=Thermococcus chitonophagus TaxID=54262 RepID=A0A160VX14_9EURY|nr:DUF2178 domain-containing protein [Thermococcus chitonophagus]ASJ16463.1 hypothetical protein A3L04_04925 [Thermococcus chitonophagus]CUX78541.1 hypothetical protein CHITON_1762 [Thermococcus chitonophagus]
MEVERIVPLGIIVAMGAFLGWFIGRGSFVGAMVVFALGAVFLNLYYEFLRRKGYILEDERIIRMEEISARRTLQVILVILAVSMIYLSTKVRSNSSYKGLMSFSGLLLFVLLIIHGIFRIYYSRVM